MTGKSAKDRASSAVRITREPNDNVAPKPDQERLLKVLEAIRAHTIEDIGRHAYLRQLSPFLAHVYKLAEDCEIPTMESALASLDVIVEMPTSRAKIPSLLACLEVINFGHRGSPDPHRSAGPKPPFTVH